MIIRRLCCLVVFICVVFLPATLTAQAYSEGTYAISFSPDSQYAAAGWFGGTALVYEIASATRVATLDCETDHVFGFGWTADGGYLACGGYLGAVLFETQTWTKVRTYPSSLISDEETGIGDVYTLAFTPDGSRLVMGGPSGAWLWDVASGELLHHLTNTDENDETRQFYEFIAVSPDGRYLTIEGMDDNVNGEMTTAASLWDVQTGEMIHAFADNADQLGPQPFSSDSTRLLVGGFDGLRVWDIASGAFVQTLDTFRTGWGVFSTDGTRIARTYAPFNRSFGSLVLLDATTGYTLRSYGRDGILSPDGKWIVTLDGAALTRSVLMELWDAKTGEAVTQLEPSATYTTHLYQFSLDSRYLLTGGLFGGATVWDVQTDEILFAFSDV